MALLILLIFLLNISYLAGNNDLEMSISPSPPAQGVMLYKVEDTLNLTCAVISDHDLVLEWTPPGKAANSQNRVDFKNELNVLTMVIRNLQENDSGEYKCTASSNLTPDLILEKLVRINVKQKKRPICSEAMFACPLSRCIHKRLVCDGKRDCPNGEDENDSNCGQQPCKNKLHCPDGRCIPYSWCCDVHKDVNCTTRPILPCCAYYKLNKLDDHTLPCKNKLQCPEARDFPEDSSYTHETQQRYDVAFFQTTVYTVIGCAMAFMFIVTILIIAICRVHMKRTMITRCSGPARNIPGAHFNIYDLDMLFNRSNDVMAVNPLLVTYNINNGVQFVGRPVDPPPYCEIVATPPREGPPPPYASHENLARRVSRNEDPVDQDGEEPGESDSLLPAARQSISVISSNSIDGHSSCVPNSIDGRSSCVTNSIDGRSTYVVSLTEPSAGGSPSLIVVETTQMSPLSIQSQQNQMSPSQVESQQNQMSPSQVESQQNRNSTIEVVSRAPCDLAAENCSSQQ